MVHIAICDDTIKICSQIEQYILNFFQDSHQVEIDVFYSSNELYSNLKSKYYDLIFLDIEIDTLTGIDIGNIIRDELKNENTQIAFISAQPHYMQQLFDLRPINFLQKPLNQEKVNKVLNKLCILLQIENEVFTYKKKFDVVKLPKMNIVYLQSNSRKITLFYNNNGVLEQHEFYGSLDKVIQQLNSDFFICIHKSYLVNYKFVKYFQYKTVELFNGQILDISQTKRVDVRDKQLDLKRKGF